MKTFLLSLTAFSVFQVLMYAIFAFVFLEPNAFNWSVEARGTMAFFGAAGGVIAVLLFQFYYSMKDRK